MQQGESYLPKKLMLFAKGEIDLRKGEIEVQMSATPGKWRHESIFKYLLSQ